MSRFNGQCLKVFVALLLYSSYCSDTSTAAEDTATTFDEKRLQQIAGSINPNRKLCTDFYSYACDNWEGPELIKILEEKIHNDTSQVLEELYTVSEPKFIRELSNYYTAYLEVEQTEPMSYLRWLRIYADIEWSLMERGSFKQWKWNVEWIELLAKLRKFGFNEIFFEENVRKSFEDPFKGVIEMKIPSLSYLYDFEQQVYVLGNLADEKTVETLNNFQMELSTLSQELVKTEEADDFNYMYHNIEISGPIYSSEAKLVSLKDLKMPWLNKYLQILLDRTELDPQMQIYVQSAKYLHRIHNFLSKYDNQLLCDYIQLKFLIYLMQNDRVHYRADAVEAMRRNFPMALQWIHGRMHPELQGDLFAIKNIFLKLKNRFTINLKDNGENLSGDIMDYMLAKVDKLDLLIFNKDAEELDLYYEKLHFLASDYYGNRLRFNRFQFQIQHSTLNKVYKRDSLEYLDFRTADEKLLPYPLPHLYPRLNVIFMPLTLLQYPFYQRAMGDTFSYSTLGYLLAHEIVKAFDSQHLAIDAQGIYRSAVQGKSDDDDGDEDYVKDPVINDMAALKLSYDTFAAYQPKVLALTASLRNKVFTMGEVFFLNYAQTFCSPMCGFHPMADFHRYDACARVNTPVRHSDTFRLVFGCGPLTVAEKETFALRTSKNS